MIRKALALLTVFGTACGGSQAQTAPTETAAQAVVEEPPPPPTYVIVHRNTPIRLQPDEDAPYLQYRTAERQEKFDARQAKDAAERKEQEKEAAAERKEKATKRRARLKKRWRKYSRKRRGELWEKEKERIEARKIRDAERELAAIKKRADRSRIEGPDRPWIPFRLVKRDGSWLQLSPVDRDAEPPHCYQNNFGEVDRLDATFWVKTGDLQKVTAKSVTIAPQHGTQVILRPGVAVVPNPTSERPDRHNVYVDGYEIALDVPASAVGEEYEPARPFEAPMTDSTFTAKAWADGKLRLGSSLPLPYNPYRAMFVTSTLWVGSRFYVTTQTPCGEFTVRAKEEHLEPVGRRGVMRLSGGGEAVSAPMAQAGAMSYLPDGTEFAKLRQDFPLGDPTSESRGRPCFRSAVWGTNDKVVSRGLELCFDREALVLED